MKKSTRNLALISVFNACLVIGFLAGVLNGHSSHLARIFADAQATTPELSNPPTFQAGRPAPDSIPEKAANGQRNLLLIGVDRLESPTVKLLSIWLAVYFPPAAHFSWLPVYPVPNGEHLTQPAELARTFRLGPNYELDPAFLSAIWAENIWLEDYVIVDEDGLAQWVDLLGGVDLGKGNINGANTLAALRLSDNSQDMLSNQINLIRGLCRKSGDLPGQFDSARIASLLAHHLSTNLNLEKSLQSWLMAQQAGRAISCEFPTLEKAMLATQKP